MAHRTRLHDRRARPLLRMRRSRLPRRADSPASPFSALVDAVLYLPMTDGRLRFRGQGAPGPSPPRRPARPRRRSWRGRPSSLGVSRGASPIAARGARGQRLRAGFSRRRPRPVAAYLARACSSERERRPPSSRIGWLLRSGRRGTTSRAAETACPRGRRSRATAPGRAPCRSRKLAPALPAFGGLAPQRSPAIALPYPAPHPDQRPSRRAACARHAPGLPTARSSSRELTRSDVSIDLALVKTSARRASPSPATWGAQAAAAVSIKPPASTVHSSTQPV